MSHVRRGLCGTNDSEYDVEKKTHNANTPGTAVLFDDLDFEDCFLPRINLQMHRQMQRADVERKIPNVTGKSESVGADKLVQRFYDDSHENSY